MFTERGRRAFARHRRGRAGRAGGRGGDAALRLAFYQGADLAFGIAVGSSLQIALFVAPLLVLLSIPLGHPLTLEFTHMEVVGMAVGVGAAILIGLDGESNWLEGVMLLGVYAILGVAFFYIP